MSHFSLRFQTKELALGLGRAHSRLALSGSANWRSALSRLARHWIIPPALSLRVPGIGVEPAFGLRRAKTSGALRRTQPGTLHTPVEGFGVGVAAVPDRKAAAPLLLMGPSCPCPAAGPRRCTWCQRRRSGAGRQPEGLVRPCQPRQRLRAPRWPAEGSGAAADFAAGSYDAQVAPGGNRLRRRRVCWCVPSLRPGQGS